MREPRKKRRHRDDHNIDMKRLAKVIFGDPQPPANVLPELAVEHERALHEYRSAAKRGVIRGIRILPSPNCVVSMLQQEKVYLANQVPALPLQGCIRTPCCACCYSPVVL